MQTEPAAPETAPDYRTIPEDRWQRFFDSVTRTIQGSQVEVEVVGLDLGDQIQAEWLSLNGLTYDPLDDTFYVYIEDVDMMFDHAISQPREIVVHMTGPALDQVVVIDADDRRHIIRLRQPLQLPSGS